MRRAWAVTAGLILLFATNATAGVAPKKQPSAKDVRKQYKGLKLKKQAFNRVSFGLLSRADGIFRLEIKNRSIYIVDVAIIKVFFFDKNHKFLSRAYGLAYDIWPGKMDTVSLANFLMQPQDAKYFYVQFEPISLSYSKNRRVEVKGYSDYRRMLYPVYHQRGKYLPLPGCGECEKDFGWLF